MRIKLTLEPRPLTKPGAHVEKILDGVLKVRLSLGGLYKTFFFEDGSTESIASEIIKSQIIISEKEQSLDQEKKRN